VRVWIKRYPTHVVVRWEEEEDDDLASRIAQKLPWWKDDKRIR